MKYKITVNKVIYELSPKGFYHVHSDKPLGSFIHTTATGQEIEVLYDITDSRKTPIAKKLIRVLPDGYYRFLFEKQAMFAKMNNKEIYKWMGWRLVKKEKDCMLFINKYMEIGALKQHNIQTPINASESVRRGSWTQTVGTVETKDDKQWVDIDSKSKTNKVITYAR